MGKHLLRGITLAIAAMLILPSLVALAYSWYIDFTVTESSGTAYTSLPIGAPAANAYYSANGYISATGLNTRVYDSANSTMPHMLTEDTTWFTAAQPANNSQVFRYTLGESALSAFKVIPGYSGNITTSDNANLELGSVFDISIAGYFDTAAGSDKDILFKDGAARLNVSAASTITWHALNADNSDNWTMSAAGVISGIHIVRIYSNGLTAYLYVDGASADTEGLYQTTGAIASVGAISAITSYSERTRGNFYAEGRHWSFYRKTADSNIWYVTSTNGVSWGVPVQVSADGTVSSTGYFSLWYDGTYVHYIRRDNGLGSQHMSYRRGEPQGDGSITWSAAEQDVAPAAGGGIGQLTLTVDDAGYAFVGFYQSGGGDKIRVLRNANNDGTWATADETAFNAGSYPSIASDPMSDDLYIVYRLTAAPNNLVGRKYDGASWAGSDETVGTSLGTTSIQSTIVWDTLGCVYVAWYPPSFDLSSYINKRSSGGSWGTPVVINSARCAISLSYSGLPGIIFLFRVDDSTKDIYYRTYDNGVLGTWTLLYAGTFDVNVMSSYQLESGVIGVQAIDNSDQLIYALLQFPWVWIDNANTWTWMAGNSMSYADNITLDVSGVRRMTYLPDAIILGTVLPDESGNGNDGTFNWGTNPVGVTVASGPLVGGTPAHTPTPPTAPWELVPTVPAAPADLFTEGGECMPGLAELADASEATGNPRAMFPIMLAFGLALLAGFGVYGATHNSRAGQRGSLFLQSITSLAVLIFFYVGGCGVIPGWVLIPFGLESLFVLIGRNPQHSST